MDQLEVAHHLSRWELGAHERNAARDTSEAARSAEPPYSNRGVYPPIGNAASTSPPAGVDAYNATVFCHPDQLVADLFCLLESAGMEPRQFDGPKVAYYAHSKVVIDDKDKQLLMVKWGGSNPHPFVECTGRASALVAWWLRSETSAYAHRPTRIDHAHDRRFTGDFEMLWAACQAFARAHGLKCEPGGDWATPDAGRTIYLGSRKSQVYVRIYEKGLKYAHDLGLPVTDELRQWLRFEIEFKPQTKRAKKLAPFIEPANLWGASQWTRAFAQEFLAMAPEPISIRERRESNTERALRAMGTQYSRHLRSLYEAVECDLEAFGAAVAELAGFEPEGP